MTLHKETIDSNGGSCNRQSRPAASSLALLADEGLQCRVKEHAWPSECTVSARAELDIERTPAESV